LVLICVIFILSTNNKGNTMNTVTVNVQIQFDQDVDGNPVAYANQVLNNMNEVLGRHFNDISPIIFTQSLDSSDVSVDEGNCPCCGTTMDDDGCPECGYVED
jgi:hypothetical protein